MTKKILLFVFLCKIALLGIGTGSAYAINLEDRIIEHTFQNGLKLIMVERHQAPILSAYIRFKVGAVDDKLGQTGIAHMLEHMLFKGTKTVGTKDYEKEKPVLDKIDKIALLIAAEEDKKEKKDFEKLKKLKEELKKTQKIHKKWVVSEEFSKIYAENGGVGYNAYTSADGTTYVINLPSNKLELWANIESDRMRDPVLREFYAERDVIEEERRRSVETRPWGVLYENFISASFVAHPYGRPIIGWMSDISNLTKKDTAEFLKTYYSPNNAIVVIVGDIVPKDVIKLIERYFASIPPQKIPSPLKTIEPEQVGEKRVSVEYDAEPSLMIGYHKPTLPDYDDDVFDVIDSIMSSGRTSRLYRAIVQEKQLATSVGSFAAPGSRFPNMFCISATPRYPHTTGEVEHAIYLELEKLTNSPVTDNELQKVKNQIDASLIHSLKSNSGLAGQLSSFEAIAGSWRYILQNRERIKKITKADIMKVAKKYFTPENRTVAILVKKPKKEKEIVK